MGFLDKVGIHIQNDAPTAVADKPAKSASVVQRVSPPPTIPVPMSNSVPLTSYANTPSPSFIPDDAIYQRLHDKTDFEKTREAQIIHKYLDTYEGQPLDPQQKFKMAIVQAAKLDGITADKLLAVFDGLKDTLNQEATGFQQSSAEYEAHEIIARQNELKNIAEQKATLAAREQQLNAELAIAIPKKTSGEAQFKYAFDRRANELEQDKAKIASAAA
jgi:hypothetical protein